MPIKDLVPETNAVDFSLEKAVSHYPIDCEKRKNHEKFISLKSLSVDDLPPSWQYSWVLEDLRQTGRRVVHLTILQKSKMRYNWRTEPSHEGSGFLTFDPKLGPLVHTSKHVVLNPEEAKHTIVRLLYDDDSCTTQAFKANGWFHRQLLAGNSQELLKWESADDGLYMYQADAERHFRSVMCSDYTCFAVDRQIQTHFSEEEVQRSDRAFSWKMAGLKRLKLGPQLDIDVAVISHPHGMPKSIAFGKMKRLTGSHPALYTTPTCPGSSGAPVVRLYSDNTHYITAGQFVHHGHFRLTLDMALGTVRPPITFPYLFKLDIQQTFLANALDVCYEPIFYWTLYVCDFLHLESTWFAALDNFAYFSTLSAMFLGMSSIPFKILFCGYWLHHIVTFIVRAWILQYGGRRATLELICTLIQTSMFLVSWVILAMPYPFSSLFVMVPAWLITLFVERHFCIGGKFRHWSLGTYAEQLKFNLDHQKRREVNKVQQRRDGNEISGKSER